MKRFLLSLVAIVITSVCFAQDIIVQKDGSTIQAKVTKVTQSEVEYKKFNNQNGPTYTISTKDLQCINYQNGTKDTFVSPSYNPNIVTNETATQFSNDQQLLKLYNNDHKNDQLKRAKTIRTASYILCPVMIAAGVYLFLDNDVVNNHDYDKSPQTEDYVQFYGGILLAVSGAAVGIGGHMWANKIKNKNTYAVNSIPIYQQEFKVGKNDRLMVGVDMLKDKTRRNLTLGLGVSYNF